MELDKTHKGVNLSHDKVKNYLKYEHKDFLLAPLNNRDVRIGKGINANLYLLKDPNYDEPDRVIKICNFYKPKLKEKPHKKYLRFMREIEAFQIIRDSGISNVIDFHFDGEIDINGKSFLYYVMEKASCDLENYFFDGELLDTAEKLRICKEITEGIDKLHNNGIYHRDIKPANILLVSGQWKICDLGLVEFRNEETIDKLRERIGPHGWLSPEATNKFLTEDRKLEFKFDCKTDESSDIFQLGKLFWFIFQCNIPVGQINKNDFETGQESIFNILFSMLQYSKSRRPNLTELKKRFDKIVFEFGI